MLNRYVQIQADIDEADDACWCLCAGPGLKLGSWPNCGAVCIVCSTNILLVFNDLFSYSTICSHSIYCPISYCTARSHIVLPDLILYCLFSKRIACYHRVLPVLLKKKFIYKNTYTVYSSNMQSQSQLPLVTLN